MPHEHRYIVEGFVGTSFKYGVDEWDTERNGFVGTTKRSRDANFWFIGHHKAQAKPSQKREATNKDEFGEQQHKNASCSGLSFVLVKLLAKYSAVE